MNNYGPSPGDVATILSFMAIFFVLAIVLSIFLFFMPMFRILKKMGYSGWWSLLVLVPFGQVIGLWILATSTWPVEQRTGPAPPA